MFPFPQVLVIGGTGQIGQRILECLQNQTTLYATSRKVVSGYPTHSILSVENNAKQWGKNVCWFSLDLEGSCEHTLEAIRTAMDAKLPTALIFCSAYTNVDGCEAHPEKCNWINEIQTKKVLEWGLKNFSAKTVFYSTDYVFDGKNGPYSEEDVVYPISVYGKAKASVEDWILKNIPNALLIRTTGVFDDVPGSKSFLMQVKERLSNSEKVRVPCDQFSNPIWAKDIAQATLMLLEKVERATRTLGAGEKASNANVSGIFHVAGGTHLSRVDFAKIIAEVFLLNSHLIEGVLTQSLNQKAKRPLRGGLKCEKLQSVFGSPPQEIKTVLQIIKNLQTTI